MYVNVAVVNSKQACLMLSDFAFCQTWEVQKFTFAHTFLVEVKLTLEGLLSLPFFQVIRFMPFLIVQVVELCKITCQISLITFDQSQFGG